MQITPRPSARFGFTLVEILGVLAVISVLMSMLLPIFYRVRERARNTTCQSNLKQIALAVQQYAQDNNAHFPAWKSAQGNWNVVIQPYIKNDAVFQCPSRQTPNPNGLGTAYNYDLSLGGINEGSIAFPAYTVLNSEGGDSTYDAGPDTGVHEGPAGISLWSPVMHSGGSNKSFLDGHVKWYSKENSDKT